ncbi:MAG: pseudouridine synthase [Planctomycetota bacterium]|jgi:23S rRNA pseudouridine2605 synthase
MKRKGSSGENSGETDRPAVRLHKYLAGCGAGSRRTCETYIEQGRVQVDGIVVSVPGVTVRPGAQQVRLDGEIVHPEKIVHYLVNKPRGFICSHAESYAPRRVVDLLQKDPRRLFFAGRLDAESEGLVFVTNDGDTANRLAHPRHGVPKTYRVVVRGRMAPEKVETLRKGVFLAEGKVVPSRLKTIGYREGSTELEVVLAEGRNREVRRIFAKVGHPVKKLVRVAIGPFALGSLAPGKTRILDPAEVLEILQSAQLGGAKKRKKKKKGWARSKGKGVRKGTGKRGRKKSPRRRRL